MKSFLLMITFFTRLPVHYPYDYDEQDFIKGIKFLPIIGGIIGLFLFLPTLFEPHIHRPILIIFIWTIYLFITGGLHIDGLADTFDGIFSYRKKEEMLIIMKDSRIGAFGVIGILWLFIFNIVLSYYTQNKLIFLIPIVGRASGLISASMSTYARDDGGMGEGFINNCGKRELTLALVFSSVVTFFIGGVFAIIPLFLTFGAVVLLTESIKKKLSGMTGDTIGAVIEISQSIFMLFCYLIYIYI